METQDGVYRPSQFIQQIGVFDKQQNINNQKSRGKNIKSKHK